MKLVMLMMMIMMMGKLHDCNSSALKAYNVLPALLYEVCNF